MLKSVRKIACLEGNDFHLVRCEETVVVVNFCKLSGPVVLKIDAVVRISEPNNVSRQRDIRPDSE